MSDTDSSARKLPRAVFLGYCAKRHGPIDECHDWGGVAEVCSASGCIAGRPPDWFADPFKPPSLNRAGCTNTAAAARERVPEPERPAYRIFAYRAIPAVFGKVGTIPEVVAVEALFAAYGWLAELPPEQDLSGFDRLGFDVVQYADALNWGCSPLSCNYLYPHHAVNRYCLIDTVEGAVEAARSFAQKEPEPGPYIILEVFRERESGHPTRGEAAWSSL
jgi:hypothetical protein